MRRNRLVRNIWSFNHLAVSELEKKKKEIKSRFENKDVEEKKEIALNSKFESDISALQKKTMETKEKLSSLERELEELEKSDIEFSARKQLVNETLENYEKLFNFKLDFYTVEVNEKKEQKLEVEYKGHKFIFDMRDSKGDSSSLDYVFDTERSSPEVTKATNSKKRSFSLRKADEERVLLKELVDILKLMS